MNEVSKVEELYALLKAKQADYVITGSIQERLVFLHKQCMEKQEQLFWFLGGPLYWLMHWRAVKKADEELGISKIERDIIRLLQHYELSCSKKAIVLVKKEE